MTKLAGTTPEVEMRDRTPGKDRYIDVGVDSSHGSKARAKLSLGSPVLGTSPPVHLQESTT